MRGERSKRGEREREKGDGILENPRVIYSWLIHVFLCLYLVLMRTSYFEIIFGKVRALLDIIVLIRTDKLEILDY